MTTPEEEFNQEVWYVLTKIQKERLATTKGKPVEYSFSVRQVIGVGVISQERQKKILSKLQEWGVLKIRENPWEPPESTPYLYYLDLIESEFERTYEKYQKACDLDSYLNDYQEKLFKGEKKPEFSQVESHKQEELDPIRKDIFGYKKPTPNSEVARKIADSFSVENRSFVKNMLETMLSLADFSSNGEVVYPITFSYGQELIKERSLLQKFKEYGLYNDFIQEDLGGMVRLIGMDLELTKEVISRFNELDSGVISEDEYQAIVKEIEKQKSNKIEEKTEKQTIDKKDIPLWADDFHWQGKKFVFGKYGSTSNFSSDDRLALFKEFTKAKGFWVLMTSLINVTNKDAVYIRQTIGQIEGSFDKELRKHISIPSTKDDELQPKPQNSAYRIRFIQESL